ncbi:bifunctional hydroxymethylpyrimidine kinase/phosphomethylpyrimidine kinase [Rubellimicrobium roseum]|uniref:hydroxymethylpyrimidine kinase n=1 Tax=Rubellimicrobium roseum TaxID=687525 RepID=A0A5C4NEB8_9RHOB|nr:bifunctional hydroxymethylpyrimidine kinase/phosphomethylpyrimidine kinase [Rubellimicrobium roseum]TNC73104.1 bifunctional hydroxymethylpyrimidine kinase/phosphomethylpyrimidine kinase [Rubellimicrobium roseum]
MGAPAALTIAGSDSGGGAGIQADLKTFSALGVYGASVITAITAQNTCGVSAVEEVSAGMIRAQIAAVLGDIAIGVVKVGMLASPAVIKAVRDGLRAFDGPVVLDPVMVAKSGDVLLAPGAVAVLVRDLLPCADLLTPNLPEAARMLGRDPATTGAEVLAQARALLDLGAKAVLMKGGHAEGPLCVDRLVTPDDVIEFTAPRIVTRNTHGTGCSLSSAIAAELAKGAELPAAIHRAHRWLQGAIRAADRLGIGSGHGPVHHFHEVWA